jgi:hypothetical protein
LLEQSTIFQIRTNVGLLFEGAKFGDHSGECVECIVVYAFWLRGRRRAVWRSRCVGVRSIEGDPREPRGDLEDLTEVHT